MSDRIKALTVILERDNRDDDVKALADAIMLFEGVASVEMQKVTSEDYIATQRVRRELTKQLFETLERARP